MRRGETAFFARWILRESIGSHRLPAVAVRKLMCLALACAQLVGCSLSQNKNLTYLGKPEAEELVTFKFNVGDTPEIESEDPGTPYTVKPRTIADRKREEIWDLSLAEAIHLALINNRIARTRNDFLSPGNQLLLAPDVVTSVYDAAIRDTGYLFGSRGVESALSVFDPVFSTNVTFGNQITRVNNAFQNGGIPPGGTQFQDSSQAVASLTKTTSFGGQFGISQTVNYIDNNQPANLFSSSYSGNLQFSYQQPLLAGAGTEFARISGPITSSIQGVSGLNQGVVIARINTDITLLDFETQVRNMVHDVEDLYWDLYVAYQNYHSLVEARNANYRLWQSVNTKAEKGLPGGGAAEEAQAREAYFEARARSEAALAGPAGRGGEQGIYGLELQLRRVCGLPANDGRIIRPSDEPTIARAYYDWDVCLATACSQREELRKQKWNIKSIELQLKAAKNLNRPQLNLVSQYQLNGLGRLLFADNGPPGTVGADLQNFTRNMLQGDNPGWNVGLQFAMPLGLRNAHAQVRNTELRLMKAKVALEMQELEVSHELAGTFQALEFYYQNMQTNYNRRLAAADNLAAVETDYEMMDRKGLDLVLQAQTRLTIADIAFYRSVIEYNKSLSELQLRQGTLLEYNHIHLAERDWGPDAKAGAKRLAEARSYGLDTVPFDRVHHEPEAFVPRHFALPDAIDFSDLTGPPPDLSPPVDEDAAVTSGRTTGPTDVIQTGGTMPTRRNKSQKLPKGDTLVP